MKNTKIILSAILLFAAFLTLSSFKETPKDDKAIWYVWIDTKAEIDGKEVRIVSEKPTQITCCVKSPKFKRFTKIATKWIQKNVTSNYSGESPLQKNQDRAFAKAMIADLKAKNDANIKFVNFTAKCK